MARELPCPSWQLALTGSIEQLVCLGSVVVSWIVVCGHVLAGSVTSLGSVVISYLVVCGHLLGLWSSLGLHVFWVFIFWVCIFMSWGHLLGLRSLSGLWSVVCPGVSVVMSGLWSSSGSVIISWIVGCGHVLGGSVLMSCVDTGCESGIASG